MTAAVARLPRNPHSIPPAVEVLYDLAGLAAVAALAHYFFWFFAVVIAPAMVGSVILMIVENIIIRQDKANAAQEEPSVSADRSEDGSGD